MPSSPYVVSAMPQFEQRSNLQLVGSLLLSVLISLTQPNLRFLGGVPASRRTVSIVNPDPGN